jgi:hypothetical protein
VNKIIKGKRYDTETAKRLASAGYSYPSQFDYWQETLYQKRTGEFFLHGEGGANSKYAEQIERNSWCGGEKIIPISHKEAKKWGEKYLDADEYEKIFGQIEEGKTTVCISLTNEAIAKLKEMALEQKISVSEWIEKAVQSA